MTITAWRIVRRHLVRSAFTGLGAKLYGGRWNSPGVPAVYCAGTISLAALEMLAHLGPADLLRLYVLIPVRFSSDLIEHLDPSRLPRRWQSRPTTTQRLGDEWLGKKRAPVLRVPTALVPNEVNYLLNPLSPRFSQIKIDKPHPFRFDPRLK